MKWYPIPERNTADPGKARELVNQSISDIQCLMNFIGCEETEMRVYYEQMLDNIANQLGKALDLMNGAPSGKKRYEYQAVIRV